MEMRASTGSLLRRGNKTTAMSLIYYKINSLFHNRLVYAFSNLVVVGEANVLVYAIEDMRG
jgi:hypothetical protein